MYIFKYLAIIFLIISFFGMVFTNGVYNVFSLERVLNIISKTPNVYSAIRRNFLDGFQNFRVPSINTNTFLDYTVFFIANLLVDVLNFSIKIVSFLLYFVTALIQVVVFVTYFVTNFLFVT